jgi:hypothetical protein
MNELTLTNKAADWRRLKALVLDSVSSPITRSGPQHSWPRAAFDGRAYEFRGDARAAGFINCPA